MAKARVLGREVSWRQRRAAGEGRGGVEAADLIEATVYDVLVAGEEHRHARPLVLLVGGGPHHFALKAGHELEAVA